MGRDDRKKASDVFQKTNYAFAEKTTFEKAFPSIDDINIEVSEDGDGVSEWRSNRYYNKISAGEFINCSNSLCYNGGFRLGDIIRHMVRNKLTEYETTKSCQGYEGSPKGRKRYGKCYNSFDVKIKIKYKEEQEQN